MLTQKVVELSDGSTVTQLILGSRVQLFPVGFKGNNSVPYLPAGPLAELIARKYHDKFHVDIDTTVAHIRSVIFIPNLRKIVSQIDRNCVFCKIKRRAFSGQSMGDLPDFRTVISPPFSSVLMDLFGPFLIRDDCVKKGPRVHKKVWGVLFSCCSTRAIHIDVAVDYDTKAILRCIRRLKAFRGNVRRIISDPGSQLVGAAKELKEWRKGWSESKLAEFGAKNGIDWQFIMASSQHQNGGAEIMVKLVKGVKESLLRQLGEHILSLDELNTVLAETASIVNSRPIGIKPNKDTDSEFLCPNSLLLGRNSDRTDAGPFMSEDQFDQGQKMDQDRFQLVQLIINQFWITWIKLYFPTLLVRKKWHHSQRNLAVGDICFLQESNLLRGEFRRCRVSKVFPDKHGVVRNVEILVAHRQDGSRTYHPQALSRLNRHVGNLIVIKPVEEELEPANDSELDHSNANDSTIFRNLDLAAPSEIDQQKDESANDAAVAVPTPTVPSQPEGGACQVPVGSDVQTVNLLQDSDAVSWVQSLVDDDSSLPDELLAGSVTLTSKQSQLVRDK